MRSLSMAVVSDFPPGMPVPVGILSRVSTDQQVEKVSLDQQESLCRSDLLPQIAAMEGGARVDVVAVYRDAGVSGDGRDRDELTKALEDVRSGRIRYLLAYDVDRLTREPAQGGQVLRACVEAKVQLRFVQFTMIYKPTGELDPMCEMMFYMRLCGGKQERQQIKERTARGRQGAIDKGQQVSRSRPRYGYHIYQNWQVKAGMCRPDQVGTYVIDEDHAPIVRDIFERAARRETLRGIAITLQTLGIPAPGRGQVWYPATVRTLLLDPIYTGQSYIGKRVSMKDLSRRNDGKSEIYSVERPISDWTPLSAVPAIVTSDLWEQANEAISTNKSLAAGNTRTRFLLSGYLRCPICSSSMGGCRTSVATRAYYHCCRNSRVVVSDSGERHPLCNMRNVRSSVLEARVIQALTSVAMTPAVVERALYDYIEGRANATRESPVTRERTLLTAEREKLQRSQRAARRAMQLEIQDNEDADVLSYRQELSALTVQLSAIESQMRALPELGKAADVLPIPAQASAHVAAMLARLPEALESPLMTVAEKRRLLDAIVLRVDPIEGEQAPTGAVAWSCKVTLRPSVWAGQSGQAGYESCNTHVEDEKRLASPKSSADDDVYFVFFT